MKKKRWLAFLLAASMLFSTVAGLSACQREPDAGYTADQPAYPPHADLPLTSARAVDHGDMTYYLDSEGTLWASYDGQSYEIARLGASQICISGTTLWYAAGSTLAAYDLTTGERAPYVTRAEEITTFAILEDKVYYLCGDKLLCGQEILLDLSTAKDPTGGSLTAVCDFELKSADEILLYLPNPDYQNEEEVPGYLLNERNDSVITWSFSIGDRLLSAYDYYAQTGGSSLSTSTGITINGWTLPFADYPVDSYFSQNGSACSCHSKGYCIANNKYWENCLRYWPNKTNPQVDLRGVQCMGFARFCQWRLFGSHDKEAPGDFYNAFGSKLTAGNWTANTVKNTFTKVGAGGHIRTGAGHSLFVISVSANGFVSYECNTNAKDCKIYTRQWTWDTFFSYAGSRELLYYNMPYNFSGGTVAPEENYEPGSYQITANGGLNMRAEPNTSSAKLVTIPNNTIVQVTAIQKVGTYYWGYTVYEGHSGWIRLDYTLRQSAAISSIKITSLPTKTTYTVGDSFDTAGLVVEAKYTDGTAFEIAGYTCSGYNLSKAGSYTVKVSYGAFSDTFTITVKEKNIPPTSITLERVELTLIVGDTYEMSYTLLPADTTQKTVLWTSSNHSAISVSDGVIKASKTGSATVTATTQNGLQAVCKVTVITMPTGINWSVTDAGQPLTSLPIGIEPVDYSIRYRLPQNGGWSEWYYGNIPADLVNYQCQFRSFTATFVNTLDGETVHLFPTEFNQVIDLADYKPDREGYLFAGWYYNPGAAASYTAADAAPRKITVTEDLLLYAGWIPLEKIAADSSDPFAGGAQMVDNFGSAGVELRVSGDGTGLRYMGRISTALIADIEALHSSNKNLQPSKATDTGIGFGMVVRMKKGSTTPLLKGEDGYLYKGGTVTVPAQRTYATYSGYILFNAFVCGYTAEYYKTDFIARPYLSYCDANGLGHTFYFTLTGENAHSGGYVTNLYDEAAKLAASDTVDPVTKKWLEDTILK